MASKSLNPQKNRLTKLIILAADYYNEIKVQLCDQYMNQYEPEFENKQINNNNNNCKIGGGFL